MPRVSKAYTSPYFDAKLKQLPNKIQKIATGKMMLFESNFLHPSLNVHKLKGALKYYWAFYVNKNYRILFKFLKNNEIIYYDIDTHDIYKK